jgi:hypothetical protein
MMKELKGCMNWVVGEGGDLTEEEYERFRSGDLNEVILNKMPNLGSNGLLITLWNERDEIIGGLSVCYEINSRVSALEALRIFIPKHLIGKHNTTNRLALYVVDFELSPNSRGIIP